MRRLTIAIALLLVLPAAASAARWSAVPLPRHHLPEAVACISTHWCQAVGGRNGRLTAAGWNGRSWAAQPVPPLPARAVTGAMYGIECRSARSCVAVGEWAGRQISPVQPLIERFDGRHWRVQPAPPAPRFDGFAHTNTRLYGVACPGARLCFAVGQATAFGAGAYPGAPVIESWKGRRWRIAESPDGLTGPLRSISCTAPRDCTAVGDAGVVVRWNGTDWTAQPIVAPAGASWTTDLAAPAAGETAAQLRAVSCTSALTCDAVGTAGASLVAAWDSSNWTTAVLPHPANGLLMAISCQTSVSCVATGRWTAPDGRTGPLGAVWNGATWRQTQLHRGPTWLESVSCPALGWCMAVGAGIAERFVG